MFPLMSFKKIVGILIVRKQFKTIMNYLELCPLEMPKHDRKYYKELQKAYCYQDYIFLVLVRDSFQSVANTKKVSQGLEDFSSSLQSV